jgi:hypothetical protein
VEVIDMMAIVGALLAGAVVFGPLGWRIWLDARLARADSIGADVRAAVNRRLRGESLLSVLVTPRLLWGRGQVIVSVPSGYEWLVEAAWPALTLHTPAGYDLVVRASTPRPARAQRAPALSELRRAA